MPDTRDTGDPIAEAEALIGAGSPAEAARRLGERIASGRGGLLARLVLARALIAAGDFVAALASARETAQLHPGIAAAAVSLGDALLAEGHLPTAIGEYQRALRQDPELAVARFGLGRAWLEAGEAEKALEAFRALAPGSFPDLAAKIVEAQAIETAPRAAGGYVRHLFDQFSADYDARMLGHLGYQAPDMLRRLSDLVMAGRSALDILDLGCGTGLSGLAFADLARCLDGVDLSPGMLEKARARAIYRRLIEGDIETAMADLGHYDLVIAADTLVYLGDLASLMASVRGHLHRQGFFLFTVEKMDGEKKDGEGFELGPKRRWRHAASYLHELARTHDLAVAGLLDCTLRHEAGVPVAGFAVALSAESAKQPHVK